MDISSEKIVELLNSTREGSVWEILDIRLVSAEKDKVVATMPIGPHHRQQVGYLHGGVSVKALSEPADIAIGVEGRGSTETLGEAGKRGRTANDDPMRRVDVTVILHSETETGVEEDVERKGRSQILERRRTRLVHRQSWWFDRWPWWIDRQIMAIFSSRSCPVLDNCGLM